MAHYHGMGKDDLVEYFHALGKVSFPGANITRRMIRRIQSRRLFGWWYGIVHQGKSPRKFFAVEFREELERIARSDTGCLNFGQAEPVVPELPQRPDVKMLAANDRD